MSILEPKPPNEDGAAAVVAPKAGVLNENADVVAVFVVPNPKPVPNPPNAAVMSHDNHKNDNFN